MNDQSDSLHPAATQDLARSIVCDTALAVLAAAGVNPSSIKNQVAMNHATDRATARIMRHDVELKKRTIEDVRKRAHERWKLWPSQPVQLELDLV